MEGGYSAYDSHDGGSAFAFIEAPPQVRQVQPTLQPMSPPGQPVMQQQQQPQQQEQQHLQQQHQQQSQALSTNGSYNGAISQADADADRQAMFFRMQENLQMQQDMQRTSWYDRCWQKRRDVMKLVVMALVILLALSAHSVAVFYIKMYVEDSSLSAWREFGFRLAYPVGILLILWGIKGSQTRLAST